MSALTVKLFREAWRMRGQLAAVMAVSSLGVATFVTMYGTYAALLRAQASYYAGYRFADVFARVTRAPESLRPRIENIPGVREAETRLLYEVTLDVPGLDEPATGRLLSLPSRLNLLHLREGRLPLPGARNEAAISEAFAAANRLRPGMTLQAVLNGRWTALRVTGVVISPEYVYELSAVTLFPDPQRFGVLWLARESLESAFQMNGAFNDVSLALAPAAREADVIASLDRLLERYGSLGAYGRQDQLSHRFLSDEIKQDRVSGIFVPAIFLAIAAFLTHIVLARVVSRQRDVIATLKAFGYSNARITFHYIAAALLPVLAGSAAGITLGVWAGRGLAAVYQDFFRFPQLRFELLPEIAAASVAIGLLAAIAGAWSSVRSAASLPPAEAMRPEKPAAFGAGILERTGFTSMFSTGPRMILRSLERRPFRALLTAVGIGLAISVLLISRYFYDAIDYLMYVQFEAIQRESATVSFHNLRPSSVRFDLQRLPGVLRVEPIRTVPARLRNGRRTYRLAVQGLPADIQLRGLLDASLNPVPLPPEGLLLTSTLARILDIRPGSMLTLEVLDGPRPVRQVRVAGFVDELIGLSAYMDLHALNRLMRDGSPVSGALLQADPLETSRLYRRLKLAPAVAGVAVREAALASFRQTIAENITVSVGTLSLFSIVIAFSIVYNSIRIALSERSHELASLRVLGFTRAEVAGLLLGEHLLLSLAAIPAGFLMGNAICQALSSSLESELYRMPVMISTRSYLYSLAVIFAATLFSAILTARGIWKLDLIQALKTKE